MGIVIGAGATLSVGVLSHAWSALKNGDTGSPVSPGVFFDATVQVEGTFGAGGAMTFQGSNDNTNWVTLNDLSGVAIVLTAAGLVGVLEAPRYFRPNITAGDGTTSLNVTLVARKPV